MPRPSPSAPRCPKLHYPSLPLPAARPLPQAHLPRAARCHAARLKFDADPRVLTALDVSRGHKWKRATIPESP